MIRKILAGLAVLLILAMAGAYMLIKTKGDVLLQKFSAYVEETTGAPLVMEALPSLTFFPQPGLDLGRSSWGREDGELFVRFERASVRVSARSLLMGRLDISGMEVHGLDLTSRPAADAPEPDAARRAGSPDASAGGNALDAARLEEMLTRILNAAPNALTVRDGHVSLIRPDGARLEFSHADLTVDDVRPGSETSLKLKAAVNGTQPDFAGALELSAKATLAGSRLDLSLREAAFMPEKGLPAPLSLRGELEYRLRDGFLTARSVAFSGPDADMALSGSAADLPGLARDPLHAAGPLSLDFDIKGSPRAVLAALKLPVALPDSTALNRAELSGHMDFASGVLKLGALDGMLDAISLNGELETRLEPLALSGDLRLGDVRLAPYLNSSGSHAKTGPKADAATRGNGPAVKSGASSGTDWQKSPELRLGLRVQSLELEGMRVEELQTRLEGQNGIYTLNPLTCRAFGSPVTAAVEARLGAGGAAPAANMTLNLSAPQIDLRQLSAALFPKLPLDGMGNLNASLACLSSNPVPTLSGKGSLSASPVTVRMNVLPPHAPGAAELDRITRFDKAMLTFAITKGVAAITECALNSPTINAEGRGEINLPANTLDVSGTVQVPGLAVLPVRLTGPLSAPAYRLDARTTLEAVDRTLKEKGVDLEQEIQKGLEKEIQKGLGRLFRGK
ncbi:MAG: hypothetical protein J1E80_06925 [Desulfovibrionaceae bacterium]|nr:hypothetical protein [Desulfovibrionaceae bacterium]